MPKIDPTESIWLQRAKTDLLKRDPCDAVNDAEALQAWAIAHCDRILREEQAFLRTLYWE